MIESEEKRKALTEDIQRWCDYVKATPLLRTNDIPSLVQTILEEFYHSTLSCGHMANSEDGVVLSYKDFVTDRSDMEHGGGMGEVQGIYCKDCARLLIKKGATIIPLPKLKTKV